MPYSGVTLRVLVETLRDGRRELLERQRRFAEDVANAERNLAGLSAAIAAQVGVADAARLQRASALVELHAPFYGGYAEWERVLDQAIDAILDGGGVLMRVAIQTAVFETQGHRFLTCSHGKTPHVVLSETVFQREQPGLTNEEIDDVLFYLERERAVAQERRARLS